ncbi:MAG TPA: hypothetical protein VK110_11465 [Salinisphaeraceae bacterium]|nr:hypothetical protein [Salinisphaeraceae bacterium]
MAQRGDLDSTMPRWSGFDTAWALGLFGTAVGAGILFLPINAGNGGLWPLLVVTLLIGPMTYLSHRALSRMVCASPQPNRDITEVVEDYFGAAAGRIITVLYFASIFPIVLIYGVGITNTVESLLIHQLGVTPWPRWLLAAVTIGIMSLAVVARQQVMLMVTEWVVYPLILALAAVTIYLIPQWSFAGLGEMPSPGTFTMSVWLIIPVLIFSFNHTPAISQFSMSLRRQYDQHATAKASVILRRTAIALLVFTMGFVWSCVLAIGPDGLQEARAANLPVLSYLANQMEAPFIAWLGPLVAITAITSSYFGHWLGAHEGAMSIVRRNFDPQQKRFGERTLHIAVTVFLVFTAWLAGVLNPGILDLIETLVGPIMALVLYIMPMYAIHKIPALEPYRGRLSNVFVTVMGLVALGAILLNLVY